jgi:DNA mismatch endonuclease (patch repair protein)
MKSNRPSGTKPELILSRLLRKRLAPNALPGNPDFVYPRGKLAVFVHGCFWHRCPIHGTRLPKTHRAYWRRKFERNVERDKMNKARLARIGWNVLEIWEHEVLKDPKQCVQRIRRATVESKNLSHRRIASRKFDRQKANCQMKRKGRLG